MAGLVKQPLPVREAAVNDETKTEVTMTTTGTPVMPGIVRRPAKAKLASVRKLTRAHLAIATRRAAVAEAMAALQAVATDLGTQLGVEVALTARLQDSVIHPLVQLVSDAVFVVVELGALGGCAVLELEPITVGLLLERAAGASPGAAPRRFARIEEAAFGWLLLSALAAARSAGDFQKRYGPRLVTVVQNRARALEHLQPGHRHVSIELAVAIGGRSGLARLLVPALPLQAALEREPADGPGAGAPEVLAAALGVDCFLGPTLLDFDSAQHLQPGDVVMFHGVAAGESGLAGRGRLVGPTFELRGAFGASGFSITSALQRTHRSQEHAMKDKDPSIPVEVEVELTRLRMPLSDLGVIKPGSVLSLHVNAAQLVTLRIGDKAVAKAELVDVEGELGARIIALL